MPSNGEFTPALSELLPPVGRIVRNLRAVVAAAPLLFPFTLAAQDSSSDYSEPYQQRALEIYRTVVGFHTAEGHGQVPAMANYLADQFRAGGFPDEDVHVFPFTEIGGEPNADLIVRYRGDGSSGEDPILLMAHMDVVEAFASDWERNPFSFIEENGYFFGRGTFDDKAGVTVLTTTFLRLRAEGFVPNRDIVIAFTGDEETGMLSVRRMVGIHRDLTDAEFALNSDAGGGTLDEAGNPTVYALQTSEKTYATFELTVTNPGGHSSTPRVDNAIYDLAAALRNIQAHRFPVMVNDATRLYFRESSRIVPGEVGRAMARIAANPGDSAAAEVLWHQPELVGITRTTCIATMLRAGHAENALPQSATATVNCRIFPGVEVSEVQATLLRVADVPGLEIAVLDDPQPSPASPIRDDVVEAVTAAVAVNYPNTPVIPYMAPYGTDGKHTRDAGIPTYGVAGLFMKDSDQFAHGLNERVSVRSFYNALEHWHVLLTRLAGRPSI